MSSYGYSFSHKVKLELEQVVGKGRHCQLAELCGLLATAGKLSDGGLYLETENEVVLRKCFTLLEKTYNIEKGDYLSERLGGLASPGPVSKEKTSQILAGTRLIPQEGQESSLIPKDSLIIQQTCCKRAYLRGAFLSSGSVNDPDKGYHFEVVYPDEERAIFLEKAISEFGAKIARRKRSYVVYVKEGSAISDLLAAMGANVAVMDFANVRVLKEMRGSINRKVNCETANIGKTVNAAMRQLEDIRYVEKAIGLDSLPETLSQMARLRLGYPEATLQELGNMSDPRVGKSGVNHRLRRLSEIADDLRRNKEERL